MGCSASISMEYKAKKRIDENFDNINAEDAKVEANKIKLLLLGAGESGKSTIFKQLKVIYGQQYSVEERKAFTDAIHTNIIQGVETLIHYIDIFGLVNQLQTKGLFERIRDYDHTELSTTLIQDIKLLWNDPVLRIVWNRRSEYQIIDSVEYYLDHIDRIVDPKYIPDKTDIMNIRIRTSGIVAEKYLIDNSVFEFYDVGGQRNERKKWIHCFEGVTSVIFVAALNEYDQVLFEDKEHNRMIEALDLFEDICNNKYFTKSAMILFLNKCDLFEAKIKTKDIREVPHFQDYDGVEHDYDAGIQYFVDKFLERDKKAATRHIFPHITCATDTKSIQVVFNACKDTILHHSLKESGFVE